LGYQSLGYTIWILTTLVVVIIVSISAVAGIANAANSENLESELIVLAFAHTTLMFGLIGVYFILPIIAAIACALGKDFRYPIMGNRLAKYLGHEQVTSDENDIWLNEEHEDRWVASMGHFSVIIMLWGLLVPATAWIMQGKRSTFLKFQSAQTIMFQATTLLLYFLSGILYVGGFLFFLLAVGGMEAINLDTGFGMIGLLVLFGSLICTFVIVLIIPLLHIMGQWAGYRVLKGDDYRYPVVGKWAEKWLSRGTMPSKAETSS
jgi:uncharacterized Tic20 family protein